MSVLNELIRLTDEVQDVKRILDEKMEKRIKWCQENRNEIKKYYPKLGEIYQIIDIKEAFKYGWYVENMDESVYYFRATDIRFIPNRDFNTCYGEEMPTVTGDVLDCNLKVIRSVSIYITSIKEIEQENCPSKLSNNFTKVYLMIDKNTGYYKIGRSTNPLTRERTLQSEKPTIELLHIFDARIKNEKEIHDMFSHKRIRGEWFDLSGSDIEAVKNFFNISVGETCR